MKQAQFAAALLGGALLSTALPGQPQETLGQQIQKGFTSENIGRAVGAITGALIGSQIGDGKKRMVAIAVGTLAGYWVGGEVGRRLSPSDRAGIAGTTQQALDTGQTQTWSNPDTGMYTRVAVQEAEAQPYGYTAPEPRVSEVPSLDVVNDFYLADGNVNVRGGPGTEYEVLHRLADGQRVPVIGKVQGSDWYMIAEGDTDAGFVYAPLLVPSDDPATPPTNAIRAAMPHQERPRTYPFEEQRCSLITQEVMLPDGTQSTHNFKACRQADGTWVRV
jgi:surface antigen